ncbi:hypothetical protein QQF64_000677 [Cirrhinus molitorella]|uniref:Uncharacterized protein n=1 Tax=Cirrhinus molitorella TaxID=172907 RepID=A0ABR3NY92_9TELE
MRQRGGGHDSQPSSSCPRSPSPCLHAIWQRSNLMPPTWESSGNPVVSQLCHKSVSEKVSLPQRSSSSYNICNREI